VPFPRSRTVTGGRADGMQQRLRHGLGEFVPYRWRGVKDWNPAKVLYGRRGTRKSRECPKCGTPAGEPCRNQAGKPMRSYHTQR
jgi:hypothetical protein